MKKRKHSLSFKISISFFVFLFVPALIGSFFFYARLKHNTQKNVEEKFLTINTELTHNISHVMHDSLGYLEMLAKNPVLSDPGKSLDEKLAEMKKIKNFYRTFEDIILINPEGRVLQATTYSYHGSWKHKKWFQDALAGKFSVSPAYIVPRPFKIIMAFTAPIFDEEGRVQNVIVGQINLDTIWSITDKIRIGKTGFVFIADQNGSIIAYPDKSRLFNKMSPDSLWRHMFLTDQGLTDYVASDGISRICSFMSVRDFSSFTGQIWHIGIIQDKSEAYQDIYFLRNQLLIFLLGGLIALFAGAYVLNILITRRVRNLIRQTERIAEGDLESEVKVVSHDELCDLADAFNRMTKKMLATTISRDELAKEIELRGRVEKTLRFRVKLEDLVTSLSTRFINISLDDFHKEILNALKTIGNFVNVDRAYVFLFHDKGRLMTCAGEWCADGIEPQLYHLKDIDHAQELPWFSGIMTDQRIFYVANVDELGEESSAEKASFQSQGIKSLICAPIVLAKELVGFVGFDSVSAYRKWQEDEIYLLVMTANIFSNLIDRKNKEENIRLGENRYEKIIQTTNTGYVMIDEETHILDVNKEFLSILGYEEPGDVLGQSVLTWVPDGIKEGAAGKIEECVKEGFIRNFEAEGQRRDGSIIPVEINATHIQTEEGPRIIILCHNITERKEAERKLKESEETYRLLTENLTDVVFRIDRHGRVEYCSPVVERFGGYNLGEVLGTPIFEYFADEKERKDVYEIIGRLVDRPDAVNLEFLYQPKTGEPFFAEVGVQPVIEDNKVVGFQGVMRDVSERKKHEMLIAQIQRQQEMVLDNTPDLVWLKDIDGRYIMANDAFCRAVNVAKDDIPGKTDYDFWDKSVADKYRRDDLEVIQTRETKSLDETLIDAQGNTHWCATIKSVITDPQGEVIATVGTSHDITSRKAFEEELRSAKEEAEAANKAKGKFLFKVSHEVRTPLTCIIGFAEMLLTAHNMDEVQGRAHAVLKESETLMGLINDLLDKAKIETGKLALNVQPMDLAGFLKDMENNARLQAQQKQLEFVMNVSPDVPGYVKADSLRLHQVLMNFITNAVKFTERGSVTVGVETEKVTEKDAQIKFSVVDTGIGIPKDKQKYIFEDFAQMDGSTLKKQGGIGLGITISKQLVEMMGGKIYVESEMGHGSSFWFSARFDICAPVGGKAVADTSESAREEQQAGVILVVEDYPANREVAKTHLESAGYQVVLAKDGREAVEITQQQKFDLILMDLQMPNMDGFEATGQIRQSDSPCRDVPILALTATGNPEVLSVCRDKGMNDVIVKPIRRKSFLETVKRWITNKQQS